MTSAHRAPVACSACGGTDDLAVVQAGGARSFSGPLRILLYDSTCRADPQRCAPWREALGLPDATEEAVLSWYRDNKTASAPDIVSNLIWGEPRPAFIEAANQILEAREAKEPSW